MKAFDENAKLHSKMLSPGPFFREMAIREALGRWVSELEPRLVYNHEGLFVGLCFDTPASPGRDITITVSIKGGIPI